MLNVMDPPFYAVGDGITDDTAAFNAALASGFEIYAPGTEDGYRITSSLIMSRPNSVFCGDGRYATWFKITNHTFDVLNVTAGNTVELKQFGMRGFGNHAPAVYVVRADHAYGLYVHDFDFNGMSRGILSGAPGSESGGRGCEIYNFRLSNIMPVNGVGIDCRGCPDIFDVRDGCMNGQFSGPQPYAGVNIAPTVTSTTLTLKNLKIMQTGIGVCITPLSGVEVNHSTFDQLWCDSNANVGMLLDGSAGIIKDIKSCNSWFNSTVSGSGSLLKGTVVDPSFVQCNIASNGGCGVQADSPYIKGLLITASKIGGNGADGIRIASWMNDFSIVGNDIGNATLAGANGRGVMIIEGGSDRFVVANNNLLGNVNGNLVNQASGGTKMIVGPNLV